MFNTHVVPNVVFSHDPVRYSQNCPNIPNLQSPWTLSSEPIPSFQIYAARLEVKNAFTSVSNKWTEYSLACLRHLNVQWMCCCWWHNQNQGAANCTGWRCVGGVEMLIGFSVCFIPQMMYSFSMFCRTLRKPGSAGPMESKKCWKRFTRHAGGLWRWTRFCFGQYQGDAMGTMDEAMNPSSRNHQLTGGNSAPGSATFIQAVAANGEAAVARGLTHSMDLKCEKRAFMLTSKLTDLPNTALSTWLVSSVCLLVSYVSSSLVGCLAIHRQIHRVFRCLYYSSESWWSVIVYGDLPWSTVIYRDLSWSNSVLAPHGSATRIADRLMSAVACRVRQMLGQWEMFPGYHRVDQRENLWETMVVTCLSSMFWRWNLGASCTPLKQFWEVTESLLKTSYSCIEKTGFVCRCSLQPTRCFQDNQEQDSDSEW